jgi:cell division protein FtsA
MQEVSEYAIGLDIGTTTVRCVVGHVETPGQAPSIIGVSEEPNHGMRKGTVVNLVATAQAIDKALEGAERMSGHQINAATVSINGSHIVGMSSRGVIAVGSSGHEINEGDLARVEDAATVVQLPANREILDINPRSYQLDSQDNIKDPLGMTGVRLEVDAYVITALAPHLKNLQKACEMTETVAHRIVVSGLAAARSVLTEQQMENGVLLIDFGGTTTNLAVFEEGDLQHVAILPVGSNNITNDLAIGLKTDLDIAEEVKLKYAVAHESQRSSSTKVIGIKAEKKTHEFETEDIDMIVGARLEEIFEQINDQLRKIGKVAKLPGGVVITGGGASLPGVEELAKESLHLSARLGKPTGLSGMDDKVAHPGFSTATGLMLLDLEGASHRLHAGNSEKHSDGSGSLTQISSKLTGIINKFRS